MQEYSGVNTKEQRKAVSQLIYKVLTGRMIVREALKMFPKDTVDETIITCWHALCHYEADEDIRAKDKLYCNEQDEYMEYLAQTLETGGSLPENIIESYKPYHPESLISGTNNIKSIISKLIRNINC